MALAYGVAMDDSGAYAVVWEESGVGSVAQRFRAAGADGRKVPEFRSGDGLG